MAILSKNTTIGGKSPILFKEIANSTVDLDNYKIEGEYLFTKITNFPGLNFYLKVIKYSETDILQLLTITENDVKNIYVRQMFNSQWQSWKKIPMFTNNVDADTVDNLHANDFIRNYGKTYRDFNALNKSGFYQLSSASNAPDGSRGLWGCVVIQTDGGMGASSYVAQIATKDNISTGKSGQMYIRKWRSGSWSSWEKLWTSGNDGSDSGLDADLLDGKHASEFLITQSNTYYINSQSDFNAMIASSRWGDKTNVVFNCSVTANYEDIVIPTSVRYINGNGYTIDEVKSFGYANESYNKNRRIENLTTMNLYDNGSLSPDVEDYRIEFTGFKNCSNLYNCQAIVQPCRHKDDLSNIRRGFSKCYNLHNCVVTHKGSFYNSLNKNILFDSCKYIYDCYGNLGCYGDSTYNNCRYIYNSTVAFKGSICPSSGGFFNCLELYNCNASGYIGYTNGNVFVNCSNLNGCYYDYDELYYSIFINCTNLINCSVRTNSTSGDFHYINCANLINCVGTKDNESNVRSTSMDNVVHVSQDLLTAIKEVDGLGSGIDADLLDGKQAFTFAKYGMASASLSTNSLTQTSTGNSSLYRFQDTNNIIGEGTDVYYGIIQIYYSNLYYTRLAISMTSGKVYRQTNGAASWNEISVNASPTIPVLTADPTNANNGQIWIRSDL